MMTPLLLLLSYVAVTIVVVLPATTTNTVLVVNAQQEYYSHRGKKQPRPQPIGDVLFMLFDQDKDGEVTLTEVQKQLKVIEGVMAPAPTEEIEDHPGSIEYRQMIKTAMKVAPHLFELLDANEDGVLKMWEFKFITKFERSLQKGGDMKQVLRDCFAIVDYNGDDEITKTEWFNAPTTEVTAVIHKLFPLRPTPEEFHGLFVKFVATPTPQVTTSSEDGSSADETMTGGQKMSADFFTKSLFASIDENRDGILQRGEVSIAYNKAGRQFLEMSKSIKQMG